MPCFVELDGYIVEMEGVKVEIALANAFEAMRR
jgi:hypothetical protein